MFLRPDPVVPSLAIALSRPRTEDWLRTEVVPRVWPGRELEGFETADLAYKAGRRCTVSGTIAFAGGSESHRVTLNFAPLAKLARIRARHLAGCTNQSACLVEEGSCLVEILPTDWKMPALRNAVSTRSLELELRSGEWTAASVRRAELLRHRPHRCAVVRYETSEGEVIGKVYSDRSTGEDVGRKLSWLEPQARELGLFLPRSLGRASRSFVAMESLDGVDFARELDGATSESALRTIEAAAKALRKFHSLRIPDSARRRGVTSELEQVEQRGRRIDPVAPELATEASALVARCRAVLGEHAAAPDSIVHGDFKPEQLLAWKGRVALIDLDRAGPGDPALDVANFAAELLRTGLATQRQVLTATADAFLEEFSVPGARPLVALALIRMGIRSFERAPGEYAERGPEWSGAQLLDEARRRLAKSTGTIRARVNHG